MCSPCLLQSFFARPTLEVARGLLGMRLVRSLNGARLSGWIVETEAYIGETDLACHARAGKTPRTAVMYGPPGRAYIYFTYGMHWLLNAVTEAEGFPAAVLLRAIQSVEGLEEMSARRAGVPPARWTDGPGKLCRALGLDGQQNGINLCDPSGELYIEAGPGVPDNEVLIGPRVGIQSTPEPWRSTPWRFRTQIRPGCGINED
ncbi:MAG: DNA-3-methyladenine glycosylase [Anaerolineaceae bacterium]|nr:DNA-3-methyladenine glycosylase [Anaerolineaceae bacterium]